MATNFTERAVLVKFTDHVWSAGTIDSGATKEVLDAHNAQRDAGHFYKRLLPRIALKTRINLGADARGFHYANTLPWYDGGWRVCPTTNLQHYLATMRAKKAEAEAAEKEICDTLEQWVERAKEQQGTMFKESDYPTPAQLRSKFGFDIDIIPVPNTADWRSDLPADVLAELKGEAEAKANVFVTEGVAMLYGKMKSVLEHAKSKMDDEKAIFRNQLFVKLGEFADWLDRLNLTGDAHLTELGKDIRGQLSGYNPEVIRVAPDIRKEAAGKVNAIMAKMSAYMSGTASAAPIAAHPADPAPEPESESTPEPKKIRKALTKPETKTNSKKALTDKQHEAKNKAARDRRAAKHNGTSATA